MLPQSQDMPSMFSETPIFLPVLDFAVWQIMPIIPVAFNCQLLINKSEIYGERTDDVLSLWIHISLCKGICHLAFNAANTWHILQYPCSSAWNRTKPELFQVLASNLFQFAAHFAINSYAWQLACRRLAVMTCRTTGRAEDAIYLLLTMCKRFSAVWACFCYPYACILFCIHASNDTCLRTKSSREFVFILHKLFPTCLTRTFWAVCSAGFLCLVSSRAMIRTKLAGFAFGDEFFSTLLANNGRMVVHGKSLSCAMLLGIPVPQEQQYLWAYYTIKQLVKQLYSKYDAWSNGDFTLEDIVGYSDDPTWGRSIYEKPLKALVK